MRLILLVVAFLVAFVLLLWWQQEKIVFQPPAGPWPPGSGARRVEYRAADGQPLFGYYVAPPGAPGAPGASGAPGAPPAGGADSAGAGPSAMPDVAGAAGAAGVTAVPGVPGVLLVFHGNADLAGWQIPWAQEVARRTGWGVFAAEYRGYAGLPGTPSYRGTQHDALAAHAAAQAAAGVPPGRVAIFGHSLGSAVGAELAATLADSGDAPATVVLQSPLTSAAAMARLQLTGPLGLIWRMIGRVHWDTEERVRALPVPVWVAHGAGDMIIPARMGQAVHAAARVPGELLLVPRAGHNDLIEAGGEPYWRFLERALADAARRAAGPAPAAR